MLVTQVNVHHDTSSSFQNVSGFFGLNITQGIKSKLLPPCPAAVPDQATDGTKRKPMLGCYPWEAGGRGGEEEDEEDEEDEEGERGKVGDEKICWWMENKTREKPDPS